MFSKLLYFATTFAEAGLSVFGLRGVYEQPAYTVLQKLGDAIEIRDYAPRVAIETSEAGADPDAASRVAFGRLFDYIAGGNSDARRVAMTAPVETSESSRLIAMTAPVQTGVDGGRITMRFFLPQEVAHTTVPAPNDPRVRIVSVPSSTLGVLRFSGAIDEAVRTQRTQELLQRLATSPWRAEGAPFVLAYDPPFTIPFLRRNEMAVAVKRDAASQAAGGTTTR